MVDVQATNEKLVERSIRIVQAITECSREEAIAALERSAGEVKTAVVAQYRGIDGEQARRLLDSVGGHLRQAMEPGEGNQ